MTTEQRINEEITKLHARYVRENGRMQTDSISQIDRTRLELVDLLSDFAKNDNTISKARINSLLRELDGIERSIYEEAYKAMDDTVSNSAEMTVVAIVALLVASFPSVDISDNQVRTIRKAVKDTVFNRVAGGMTLDDRLRNLSGDYNNATRDVLRRGILQGKSVDTLVRDIKSVYDGEEWKIRRLVITEGNASHRLGVGESANKSEVVSGLRLIPGRKLSPGCVNLAAEDRYGLGTGIFLPSDPDIYSPHVQCTSYLEYVIKPEYLSGGGR